MDAKSAAASSALRSCTTCSKAKAKCVRAPGQGICERCSRLKKECHSREPVLRRRKVIKTTRAAQLEKLENKIEHLVNALATTQSQRGFSVDLGQPSPPISSTSERPYNANDHRILEDSLNARQQAVLHSLCDPIDESGETTPCAGSPGSSNDRSASNTQASSPVVQYADYSSVGVPLHEAEILLDRYRRLMAPAMPFVVLPPGATAHSLFNEKPTLLHAIVVVASFDDLAKQQANVKRLQRNLSERIMINCEKSIDILQAILVFVGWYHPHIFWSQQCTNLLHLAIAMIIDLGYDRSPQQCGDFKKSVHRADMPSTLERVPLPEEHRILAGVFYLTSTLSSSFKKIDAMPWTPYLATCLQTLETNAQHESDLFLVQIVRLQHLIEEASTLGTPQGPMQMYIKAFTADLTALRKSDPCSKSSDDSSITTPSNNAMNNNDILLQLQYLTTSILIWELALNDLQENRDVALHTRIADLCQLIDSIKAFLDLYFTLPVASYLTMPFSVFAQFAHAFVVLIKIASLEVDGWDFRVLTSRLDFLAAVEEAAVRFEGSVTAKPDGLEVNNDHFGKWAIRIRWMRQVYEAKFVVNPGDDRGDDTLKALFRGPGADEGYGGSSASASAVETPASTTGGAVGQQHQQPTPPDDVLSGDFFNYLDENFWNSFAGDFDLGYPEVSMV